MSVQQFRLPDLGEGLPEAEIVAWHVAPGDTVTLNQTIAEVETAKAVVELPSPFAGTVAELSADAGDTVAVGDVLISFDITADDDTAAPDPHPAGTGEEPAAADQESAGAAGTGEETAAGANLVGYGAGPSRSGRPQRRQRSAATVRPADADVGSAAPHDDIPGPAVDDASERPRSTPPVRKLAKDLGVDLALVQAGGATGVITREDVEAFAARLEGADGRAEVPAAGRGRETRVPIRGVRKATAEAMVRSAFTAPHVTVFLTVDATATVDFLASLRAEADDAEPRIGILAVAAFAACRALARHPELNSRWHDAAGEIVQQHSVHLGIAAATDRGLLVPNIREADRLDLRRLAAAIRELTLTARAGKTPLEALRGGTFSITNFGVFGVDAGTPIINPGEAAILGIGAVQRRPWEHRGEIALRDVVTLSLSFDHRLADGRQGSLFLSDVAGVLREPGRAMLLG